MLGNWLTDTGQYGEAQQSYQQALALFEWFDAQEGIRDVFTDMGVLYDYPNDHDTAMQYYEKALRISKEIGDALSIAKNVCNIGLLYMLKGDYCSGNICLTGRSAT